MSWPGVQAVSRNARSGEIVNVGVPRQNKKVLPGRSTWQDSKSNPVAWLASITLGRPLNQRLEN